MNAIAITSATIGKKIKMFIVFTNAEWNMVYYDV